MKNIAQDIKNRTFRKVYLLYGNEPYLKQYYLNRLKEAVLSGDTMNYHEEEGHDVSLSVLRDFTDTMPFFADKRLLVLKDTGLFKSASEGYAEWIQTLPETACVIFSETETDKRNRLYKKVTETGYVSEMNHPDEETMKNWVLRQISDRGLKITRDAFEYVFSNLPEEMDGVLSEVTKLCDFCMDREGITRQDAQEVITPHIANRIFDMTEALAERNIRRSLDLYYDLIALKEPPMRILFLIERTFNQLMLLKKEEKRRTGNAELAALLGVRPFVVNKLKKQAAGYSDAELSSAVQELLDLEKRVKTGDLQENMAAELFIIRTGSQKKHE